MKKLAILILALLFAHPAIAQITTTTQPVGVPTGSTIPFFFRNNGTASWPLVQAWDGVNVGVILPPGPAIPTQSFPTVTTPSQITSDPCYLGGGVGGSVNKITIPISTTAGTLQLVAPVVLQQVFVCHILVKNAAATSVSLVGGLGSTCATGSPLAIIGSTTPANGVPLGALGDGIAPGDGGFSVYRTTTSGHGLCLTQSGTVLLAGSLTYVQQ